MARQVIYRKTAKGQEEMATRAFHLAARERSLLVLVDGKKSAQELIEKSRHLGDSSVFLEHLAAEGFIEPCDGSAPLLQPVADKPTHQATPAATALPAAKTGPAVLAASTRKEVIGFARVFLFDTLGPDADTLASRIEASRNQNELALALEKGRDALRAIAGRRRAEEFWQGVRARLPQIDALSQR